MTPVERSILLIVADGELGGGTTIVRSLASELLVDGWQVHVATQQDSPLQRDLISDGIVVHPFDFFVGVGKSIRLQHRFRRLQSELNPSIVHSHGSRALWMAATMHRTTSRVHTVHGHHLLKRKTLARLSGQILERFGQRHVDTTIFVSTQDLELAKRHRLTGRTQSLVIRNGVAIPTPLRQPSPRGNTRYRVAVISRLEYQKDPLLAVSVAAELGTDFEFLFIGDGSLRSETESLVRELGLDQQVQLLGSVNREDALAELSGSDVLLLTSRWEGLPLAPMEAMHLGVPVVGPDQPAMRELISNGVSGVLVPTREAQAFAAAVRKAVDKQNNGSIISNAIATAAADFSWSSCWEAHLVLYSRLASLHR